MDNCCEFFSISSNSGQWDEYSWETRLWNIARRQRLYKYLQSAQLPEEERVLSEVADGRDGVLPERHSIDNLDSSKVAGGISIGDCIETLERVGIKRADIVLWWRDRVGLPEQCDRPAVSDGLCELHAPPSKKPESAKSLLERIDQGDGQNYVGAIFEEINFEREQIRLDNNYVIRLDYSSIGELDAGHARFENPISFDGCQINKNADIRNTLFNEDSSFRYSIFRKGVNFAGAEFGAVTDFSASKFEEGTTFQASKHGGVATFDSCAVFSNVQFRDDAHFMGCFFDSSVDFSSSVTGGDLRFDSSNFSGHWVRIDDTTVKNTLNLQSVKINEKLTITDSETTNIQARDANFQNNQGVIDLSSTKIESGLISLPDNKNVYSDLKSATLGDVDLTLDSDSRLVFNRFRIHQTSFEGFDFRNYHEELETVGWKLHHVSCSTELDYADLATTPADREGTYIKAKNGAKEVGDGTALSYFSRLEKRSRRAVLWNQLHKPIDNQSRSESVKKRITAGYRYISNLVFDLSCGYGEKPQNTIISSIGVIFLFAIIYDLLEVRLAEPTGGSETFWDYLSFSLGSFVSLLIGEGLNLPEIPEQTRIILRALVPLEAFLGAFFIALFVFSLTRLLER